MTTQIYNAEMVDLLRSNFPDRQRYAKFAYNVNAIWYDHPLNGNDDSDHFNDNTSTYPTTWTEVDAATTTDTNDVYGFWTISGYPGSITSWKYRKQLSYDIEADTANGDWLSIHWGPLFFRDGQYPNDLTYYLGFYADNSGAIDETIFLRIAIQWDSSAGAWQARGERKDGTTQTNGSWVVLSGAPIVFPLYIRQSIRFFTSGTDVMRTYLGSIPVTSSHTILTDDSMQVTWGQIWAQIHMSRSNSGVNDFIWLGAIDRGTAI